MENIELYENYSNEKEVVLTSRQNRDIRITVLGARIQAIVNNSGINFPFKVGQPYTRNIEQWATNNSFSIDGVAPKSETKVFGIRTKDIPNGHELRMLFPGKFKD
jgi:hypothetical protein